LALLSTVINTEAMNAVTQNKANDTILILPRVLPVKDNKQNYGRHQQNEKIFLDPIVIKAPAAIKIQLQRRRQSVFYESTHRIYMP
jgi:hypothetical protein